MIAQPDASGNTWDTVGFTAVPTKLLVSAYNGTTKVLTVANHRLNPGDAVLYNNTGSPLYAIVLGPYSLQLADTQNDALLGTGVQSITYNSGDYIVKQGASGMPMPSGRQGYYTENNRLVIVNGNDNIAISDPLDPLHYTPMQATLTANVGEADPVNAIASISSSDVLLFLKSRSVLAIYNFSEGPTAWTLRGVTHEYGCVAPNSVLQWGANLMFLSRRGYDRVQETAFGWIQPVTRPVSFDMEKYIDKIDWNNAGVACAQLVDNRLLLALPLVGASAPTGQNNTVLAMNLLNSNAAQETFFWEGGWTGLSVYNFAIHPVYGRDRITYCDYNAKVSWLGEGWNDVAAAGTLPIATSVLTRSYFHGATVLCLKGQVNWDTLGAGPTVSAVGGGYNETTVIFQKSYDKTQYEIANAGVYNPATATTATFNAPYRSDYSASAAELFAGSPGIFQNTTEPLRLRYRGNGIQLLITNAEGSLKLNSVELAAKPAQVNATTV